MSLSTNRSLFGQLIDAVQGYIEKSKRLEKSARIRLELFRQRFVDLSELSTGDTFLSPGGLFRYRVVGPVCRLFDRETLPWPCCRIVGFKGKEPSWRRVGRRLVADIATRTKPSYFVVLVDPITRKPLLKDGEIVSMIYTLYWVRLSEQKRLWWFTPSCKVK
jgi:hypothetical protein